MRNLLIFLSLALFSSPLLAGRDVSAIRYAPSDVPAGTPAIASNGTRFLTLWPTSGHILGSLSDSSGGSNSPAFAVVPFANASAVQVIGTGSGYVAIWNERDNVPIFGRLTSGGVLERRVPLAGTRFAGARLAFNGRQIAILDAVGSTIDIALYDLDGNLLYRSPVAAYSGESYAVTPAGADFTVVTAGATGINEFRVTNDGAIHTAIRIQPPADPLRTRYVADVAARNGRVLIAWIKSPAGHQHAGTVGSATIQPDGTVTQTSSAEVPAATGGLVLLPLDHGYVLALTVSPFLFAGPQLFALRLDDTGKLLDDHPLFLGDGQASGAASFGNTIKFAFVPIASPVALVTLTAIAGATGIAPQPPAPLLTAVRQFAPAVAGNGGGFTAAWMERESGAKRIVAARVNVAGEPLDGTGIVLDPHGSLAPAIAHGPAAELIVWAGNGRLRATRLSPFGGVLDATPIDIAPLAAGSYSVAWNGSQFFVVWTDGTKLFRAFVAPDGVATSPKDLGVRTSDIASGLDVAWDGRQYILVYAEASPLNCTCFFPYPDRVRITLISAAGTAIDSVLVPTPRARVSAHVASSGSESLVVLDREHGPSSIVVRGEGGALHLDPEVPLFNWFAGTSGVAWDGSGYVVAVRYALSPAFATDPGWLAAIHVSQSGIPLRTVTTPTAGPPDFSFETAPSIATDAAGGTAFVISEVTSPTYGARARLYLLSEFSVIAMPAPPPAPRNAVSYFGGTTARIDWQSDGGGNGFLIERSTDFGNSWFTVTTIPADARTITVTAKVGDQFRVRAFGPGGLSDGPVTSIGSMFRHRAERH